MLSYFIALAVFLLTLAGLSMGGRMSARLPGHHLVSDARDSAKIGIGMVATLLALVLGLMITSAKRSFDEREAELVQVSTSIMLLDGALEGFGEDARPARTELRGLLDGVARLTGSRKDGFDQEVHDSRRNLRAITQLQQTILALKPQSDAQAWFRTRAMQLSISVAEGRVLSAERTDDSVPVALLVIVCYWFVLIYVGLGVFLVINRSVNVALAVCALAFACSIFIILELETPYSGVVGVSSEAISRAQAELMR